MGNKKVKKSIIAVMVSTIEKPELRFKPTDTFYKTVGINNRRFAKLLRGDLSPTLDEFKTLCSYFKVSPAQILN